MPICVNGRLCYCLADVICLIGMWQMLLPRGRGYPLIIWMVDVIAIVMLQMFLPLQYIATLVLADAIAKWQMGIATCYCLFLLFLGTCLLPCGRWNSQYLFCLWWQMLLPNNLIRPWIYSMHFSPGTILYSKYCPTPHWFKHHVSDFHIPQGQQQN